MPFAGKIFTPLFLVIFVTAFSGNAFPQNNYCNIFGSVFIVDNPKEADFRVFIEDSEGSADVWVYDTDDKLFADRPGLWYFTNQKAFSDFTIYIEKDKYLADFSIYYINTESFAGCND